MFLLEDTGAFNCRAWRDAGRVNITPGKSKILGKFFSIFFFFFFFFFLSCIAFLTINEDFLY